MKKLLLSTILSTFYFLLPPSFAHAQSIDLSVTPPVVEILLAPNKKVEQTFSLTTNNNDLDITPEIHLAKPSDSTGHIEIDQKPIVPSTLPLTIKLSGPNTSPTLTLEAASSDVSQDVYLALVFKASSKDDLSTSTAIPGISALILVTITSDGILPINLELKDFELPFIHDSWLPFNTNPVLENRTPIMIRPEGKYEIINWSGKSVFSADLYPHLILGDSSRKLQTMVDSLPQSFAWSPKWSNIGPHKIRLSIRTQGGTKLSETEKLLWILPIRALIILLLLTVIISRLTRSKQPTTLDT